MTHDEKVAVLLSAYTDNMTLKTRESTTVEFKEAFNKQNIAQYARTMAAFSNNQGGYIIFGVTDNPRIVVGLKNDNFDNLNQEKMTNTINDIFSPAIDWDCGCINISSKDKEGAVSSVSKKIGWIYTKISEFKPVIAKKNNGKISSGDVYYRYRARTQKIEFAEMAKIISERASEERKKIFKLLEKIRRADTANLGIVNYSNGVFSTPHGVDVEFERKLITEVLKEAKFIKEGSFNETKGMPALKVTGNIEVAEEVPVPEGNPNDTHPYTQKELAKELSVREWDVYALVWYYKMKEDKKFSLEITMSNNKIYKFSSYALQFLKEKWKHLKANPEEWQNILDKYHKMRFKK